MTSKLKPTTRRRDPTAQQAIRAQRAAEAEARRKTYCFNRELRGCRSMLGMTSTNNQFRQEISKLLQENHNMRLMLAEKLATWKQGNT